MESTLELVAMAKKIILIGGDPKGRISVAVKEAARLIACERCCLILINERGELSIAEGVPEGGHGIGMKISPQHGEHFLMTVIEQGVPVVIHNPCSDRRTAYMQELIVNCNIRSMLFAPLFHRGRPLGLLVFDSTDRDRQKFSTAHFPKINAVVELVAASIAREEESRKRKRDLIRRERMCALGENSLAVLHTFRNRFTKIGGFAHRILTLASKDAGELGKIKESATIIVEEVATMEQIANNVLQFVKFSPEKLSFENANLNEFVRDVSGQFSQSLKERHCLLRLALDSRLAHKTVPLDKRMLGLCLDYLLKNACEARATHIVIRTKMRTKFNFASIYVEDNGEKIQSHVAEKIFSPFMTTKPDGTGIGLAIVKAIVEAHRGEMEFRPYPETQFAMHLPLHHSMVG